MFFQGKRRRRAFRNPFPSPPVTEVMSLRFPSAVVVPSMTLPQAVHSEGFPQTRHTGMERAGLRVSPLRVEATPSPGAAGTGTCCLRSLVLLHSERQAVTFPPEEAGQTEGAVGTWGPLSSMLYLAVDSSQPISNTRTLLEKHGQPFSVFLVVPLCLWSMPIFFFFFFFATPMAYGSSWPRD